MLSNEAYNELRHDWLPNITNGGLDRLIELLQKGSPLLIHGSFLRSVPMGCLATHIAWHHPRTAHRTDDAGVLWLQSIAGLHPASSHVIREWDGRGANDVEVRNAILDVLCAERDQRECAAPEVEELECVSA